MFKRIILLIAVTLIFGITSISSSARRCENNR